MPNITQEIYEVEQQIIMWVHTALSSLSFVIILLLIIIFVYFGRLRHMSSRLSFYLLIMCLIESVANFLSLMNFNNQKTELCLLQASLLQFTRISQLSWILVIAVNLYIVVVNETVPDQYEIIYHVSAWLSSIVFTLLPIVYHYYGFNEIW